MTRFHDISPAMAGLMGGLCGTLLYGVLIALFSFCIYLLLQRRALGMKNSIFLLILTTLQFIISTIYLANSWRMLIEAFIWESNIPNETNLYWVVDPSRSTQILSKTLIIANSILADFTLIWRLYVVWGSNWIICVLPCVSVVAYTIVYFTGIAKLAVLVGDDFFVLLQYGVAGITISAITHIMVTCLIAGKIWWTLHRNPDICRYSSGYMSAFWTIVESGALYSITAIFLVIFFALRTQAGGLISDIFVQLSAVVPGIVILRAGMGIAFDTKHSMPTLVSNEFPHRGTQTDSKAETLELVACREEKSFVRRGGRRLSMDTGSN